MREMENKDETLAKMREERWALYIARAVERFDAWWLHVLVQMEQSKRLEGKQMISTNLDFRHFTERGRIRQWARSMLAPIGNILIFLKSVSAS
jgi:hypothetical protein